MILLDDTPSALIFSVYRTSRLGLLGDDGVQLLAVPLDFASFHLWVLVEVHRQKVQVTRKARQEQPQPHD